MSSAWSINMVQTDVWHQSWALQYKLCSAALICLQTLLRLACCFKPVDVTISRISTTAQCSATMSWLLQASSELNFSCLIYTSHVERVTVENRATFTSSYKPIGGDGRGGEAGNGGHYGCHSNDQTGESCRGEITVVSFRNVPNEKNVQYRSQFSSRHSKAAQGRSEK